MADVVTARLDAFTDAAFAFAVTLLVVGVGAEVDALALRRVVASIPAFAIGFALIAMFWLAHVRWRRFRGRGDWRSLVLTLALVFAVLLYVLPLRAMASALAAYLGAAGGFHGDLGELFAVYGLGFVTMSALVAALFRDALRNGALDRAERATITGELWIWSILAGTGAVSVVLSLIPETTVLAPWAYATLPFTIGLFAARWDWDAQGSGTA
ncbi:MAG: TMEM175 family protein [Pseudomonadota bacterium]